MRPIRSFFIKPALPPRLEGLRRLAYNLWWCWNMEAINLFRRLDEQLWERTGHNPVLMLGTIDQARLERAAHDEAFLAHMERVLRDFDGYMASGTSWCDRSQPLPPGAIVAYFSAEFGLTDCIPNYSGGLGILAGDHLKSASDLGLPLIGVGLLYQQGYFHQYLSADGWQQENYPMNDFYTMPLQLERRPDGTPLTVEVRYPGHRVEAQVWWAQVGRVPLLLLDTNLDSNDPVDRDITDQLYGGDIEMRIRQEIVLGIGGVRALKALGFRPTVCHMNEGHSAFLALERIRMLMEEHNLSFAEAREVASASQIFTTHTPVLAGIDLFPPYLIDKYFSEYYPALGLSREEFLALGRVNPSDASEPFSMAVLALKLSGDANGVSKLHGQVARGMWRSLWPNIPEREVPIQSLTNGVHLLSWVSHDMAELYDRYLGPAWQDNPADPEVWRRVDEIPDSELWRTHERRRERLIAFARRRLHSQLEARGAPATELERAWDVLDPRALTIGFGRRFATYKRATLLLKNPERLAAILNNPDRPVQIIYAGKAHPADYPGKELIRQIVQLTRDERFRRRIVFIEDYDMIVARYMVQGADLWLNTPLRYHEASGTSGMKAAANGVLNISTLDGWWDEVYSPEIGWAIGRGEVYEDKAYQEEVESNALYNLLESEVVPLFYERGPDGLPRKWIAKIKAAMKTICPYFNTARMVMEYTQRFYMPGTARYIRLTRDGVARAKALAAWKAKLYRCWPEVRVLNVEAEIPTDVQVGAEIIIRALIHLGELSPGDVKVELYHGSLDSKGEISSAVITVMECTECAEEGKKGEYLFTGTLICHASGRYGYNLRVMPYHEDIGDPYRLGLVRWANF